MKIQNVGGADLDRATKVSGPASAGVAAKGASRPEESSPAGDRVEFSEAGRAMADALDQDAPSALSPERIAELRQRIAAGAYDAPNVVDEIARRILDRGDV